MHYDAAVRARAIWLATLALAGCMRSTEVSILREGTVAAVLIRVDTESGRTLTARAFDPADRSLNFALEPGVEATILSYPRPLSDYGISVDSLGDLARDDDGVGLPPPAHWARIDEHGEPTEVDPRATPPDVAFPTLRIAAPSCARLVEVPGARMPVDAFGPAVTFVGALDAERTLIGYGSNANGTTRPYLAVASRAGEQVLPYQLGRPPVGFTEAPGSLWVLLQVPTSTQPDEVASVVCHFRSDDLVVDPTCNNAGDPPVRVAELAGRRGADGVMELFALTVFNELYHARDGGPWKSLYVGARPDAPECGGFLGWNVLEIDGPGTGVVSFSGGTLERFRVSPGGAVSRTPLFPGVSCSSAYARHPTGVELFTSVAGIDTTGQRLSQVWWRPDGDVAFRAFPDFHPTPASLTAVGDALLAPEGSGTMAVLTVDPRRPDLAPRRCASVGVFSTGGAVADAGDGTWLIGGGAPGIQGLSGAVSRWRVER